MYHPPCLVSVVVVTVCNIGSCPTLYKVQYKNLNSYIGVFWYKPYIRFSYIEYKKFLYKKFPYKALYKVFPYKAYMEFSYIRNVSFLYEKFLYKGLYMVFLY